MEMLAVAVSREIEDKTIVMMVHEKRRFPRRVQYLTTPVGMRGCPGETRFDYGLFRGGDVVEISDLCKMRPDPQTGILYDYDYSWFQNYTRQVNHKSLDEVKSFWLNHVASADDWDYLENKVGYPKLSALRTDPRYHYNPTLERF